MKKLPDGWKILDSGAGEQPFKKYCSHLEYVSQDFGAYDGIGNQKGLHTSSWNTSSIDIISDIVSIPLKDGSVDAILCTEVFEHVVDPNLAIAEFSRLIKKSGKLLITAPFASLTHFSPYHFSTGFNRYFYEAVLPKNGFQIIEITPVGSYYEYLAQELRRLPSVAEQYSKFKLNSKDIKMLRNGIRLMANLSKSDVGSSELLCLGYFVVAEKIS